LDVVSCQCRDPPIPEVYSLALHDALPISALKASPNVIQRSTIVPHHNGVAGSRNELEVVLMPGLAPCELSPSRSTAARRGCRRHRRYRTPGWSGTSAWPGLWWPPARRRPRTPLGPVI